MRRFSWDLGDPEPRLRLAVLRALVLASRASLLPERPEGPKAGEAHSEALSKALGRLGFEERSHELQDALQSCTVAQLRAKKLTKEDFDSCLRPVKLLSDGERRRLWRFVMELRLDGRRSKALKD